MPPSSPAIFEIRRVESIALTLYFHPLSSFCQKVLIALYENGTPFKGHFLNLMDPAEKANFRDLWPVGKMPVLIDDGRGVTFPETTIIIEYLKQHYPGTRPLLPRAPDTLLDARLWDRVVDSYLHVPMHKVVTDIFRPKGANDPHGVADAKASIRTVYGMINKRVAGRIFLCGEDFSIADCAATPAFYTSVAVSFADGQKNLAAYFERLMVRPSVKRAIEEAKPFFKYFPLHQKMQARFR